MSHREMVVAGGEAAGVAGGGAGSAAAVAELRIDEPQLRLAGADGRTALSTVIGLDAARARARLRFGPGRTCEPLARLLDRAIQQAAQAGLSPQRLIVAAGSVQAAEDIVRVRRKAHGKADWISSPTSRVQISLRPAGLHATASAGPAGSPPGTVVVAAAAQGPSTIPTAAQGPGGLAAPATPAPGGIAAAAAQGPGGDPDAEPGGAERAGAVREALFDVIDPDLGVNIVDLGFVRSVNVPGRTAVITMTLTSAACPLTSIMEDQIRTGLTGLADVDDFRVNWVWLPPWRPADITESGREQLRAIGFSF